MTAIARKQNMKSSEKTEVKTSSSKVDLGRVEETQALRMSRLALTVIGIFAMVIITMTVVVPQIGLFVAQVTQTTTSSSVLSAVEVCVFPVLFATLMLAAGEIALIRFLWRKACAPRMVKVGRFGRKGL